MAKIDDWVEVKSTGNVGVVAHVGDDVTVRIPQTDWPFPRYVTVPHREIRKYRVPNPKYEKAPL
jgi:hypothetical protein